MAFAACLAVSPRAEASTGQRTIFDATSDLLFDSVPHERRMEILDRLDALGVDTLRVLLPWRSVAPQPDDARPPDGFDPSDPADYPSGGFSIVDDIVQGAQERGIEVLLTPTGLAPDWASRVGDGDKGDPDPGEFRAFVTALGRRYNGNCTRPLCVESSLSGAPLPRVGFWSVWNEPNLQIFLRPQRRNGKLYSGRLYRRLWLAAEAALDDTGHGDDPMLIGETAPSRGSVSTPPLDFLRSVFCLSESYKRIGRCKPLDAAGWAQHPYNPYDPPWRKPDGRHRRILAISTLPRLLRVLGRAAAAGATRRRLPVYVTEYGIESFPDPFRGVSLLQQAEWIAIAEYILYRNPRIKAYAQYLMNDDRGAGTALSFQTGLRFASGEEKPSYHSFALPLVARRKGARHVELWGRVRPGVGSRDVEVLVSDDGSVRTLDRLTTDARGYFSLTTAYEEGRRWRAEAQIEGGRVVGGPFIRSYRFK